MARVAKMLTDRQVAAIKPTDRAVAHAVGGVAGVAVVGQAPGGGAWGFGVVVCGRGRGGGGG
ncbi:hypothetical protein IC63_06665, partial [Paracoccus sphaerophysae]